MASLPEAEGASAGGVLALRSRLPVIQRPGQLRGKRKASQRRRKLQHVTDDLNPKRPQRCQSKPTRPSATIILQSYQKPQGPPGFVSITFTLCLTIARQMWLESHEQ